MSTEVKKIEEVELEQIKATVNQLQEIQKAVGSMELEKHTLTHQYNEFKNELSKMQKQLREKYGEVNISLIDGSISEMPKEDGISKLEIAE